MSRPARAAFALLLALVASCAPNTVIRGRILESGSGAPLPNASVWLVPSQTEVGTDSSGRFELLVPKRHGCIVIRAAYLDHQETFRTLPLPRATDAEVVIALSPNLVPERPGLYLQGCVAPDTVHSLLGLDTVLVH